MWWNLIRKTRKFIKMYPKKSFIEFQKAEALLPPLDVSVLLPLVF